MGVSSPLPWLGGMAGVVLAVAGAASALRAWEPESAPAPIPLGAPAPTVATLSQPGVCPVDEAICEFAKHVEFEYWEGDPTSLLSQKSEYWAEAGVLRGQLAELHVALARARQDQEYFQRMLPTGLRAGWSRVSRSLRARFF